MNPAPIKFYKELESSLATSSEDQRKTWATFIIEQDIDIDSLFDLLKCERKTATRFLWMLGRIGMTDATKLYVALASLLEFSDQVDPVYKMAFANFWLLAGVPPENEGRAVDLLFEWLLSADANVTIKSRSLSVLFHLTKKYPELTNELKLCLEDQMDKHSNEFKRKAEKIQSQLGGEDN